MKILFLVPAFSKDKKDMFLDICFLNIASYLYQYFPEILFLQTRFIPGVENYLTDENNYLNLVVKEVKNINPQVLFIHCVCQNLPFVIEFVEAYKSIDSEVKIVVFGTILFWMGERIFNFMPSIDAAIYDQNEITFLNLLRVLQKNNKSIEKVKGILFKRNGQVIKTSPANSICRMDELPFTNHDLALYFKPSEVLVLEAGRGCNYSCRFCTCRNIKYITKSPVRLVEEMKYLHKKYNIEKFIFESSTGTTNKKWFKDFCQTLLNEKVRFKWKMLSRIDEVSGELLDLAFKAGCFELAYGIESLNPETLLFLGKTNDPEKYIKDCHRNLFLTLKARMLPSVSLIVGTPNEGPEEIRKTSKLADYFRCLGVSPAMNILFTIYGTPLWNFCKKSKIELVPIKNRELLNRLKNVSTTPALFYEKYKHIPELVPRLWMLKNKYYPQDEIEEIILKNCYPDYYHGWKMPPTYLRLDGEDGLFKKNVTVDFDIFRIDIWAASRKVLLGISEIPAMIYINGISYKDFYIENDLKTKKYTVHLDEPIRLKNFSMEIKTHLGYKDVYILDNIFVWCADLIGAKALEDFMMEETYLLKA